MEQPEELDRYLPLKPQDLHILLVLGGGVAHGYGIMKAVEDQTEGRVVLEVGSLYRLLGRLLDEGLIDQADPPADETDARRRYYEITRLGRAVAQVETRRLAALVASPAARHLMEERR
jgi:DNA-binding PadR family transcriptional regulator